MTKQEHLIAVAETVFKREQVPSVRMMVGCLIAAASAARVAASTQDRIATLVEAAGVKSEMDRGECFERVAGVADEMVAVFVKVGFISADDPLLKGPHA